ncbi:MAG: hypothetical protein ACWA5U_09565 [bacterium]|jgi:hypothetical protein
MEYTIRDLETDIFEIEHFPIILRLPSNAKIPKYTSKKAADGNFTIKKWEEQRLQKILQDKNVDLFKHHHHLSIEVVILLPDGKRATRSMKLKTLRNRYREQH